MAEPHVFSMFLRHSLKTLAAGYQKIDNAFRLSKLCEPYEAYCKLRDNNMLKQLHNFEEKVFGNNSILSNEGRSDLLMAITSITKQNIGLAPYTCEPCTIIIGNVDGKLFVVHTQQNVDYNLVVMEADLLT